MLFTAATLYAQEKVEVFPSAPYARYIIFQTLAVFWVGIIGLIVIIRMKLKEIERTQRMNLGKEEKDVPLLD
jgi:hypothetical protein